MKTEKIIYSKTKVGYRLRSINENDIEEIRVWKNSNKKSFFHKAEIEEEQQKKWFVDYLKREGDYVFIAEVMDNEKWIKYGCLGYRIVGDSIDLYNIIRGQTLQIRSSMKVAMKILIEYLTEKYALRIKCDVLIDNPAVKWYNECGFYVKDRKEDYYIMQINEDRRKLYD